MSKNEVGVVTGVHDPPSFLKPVQSTTGKDKLAHALRGIGARYNIGHLAEVGGQRGYASP